MPEDEGPEKKFKGVVPQTQKNVNIERGNDQSSRRIELNYRGTFSFKISDYTSFDRLQKVHVLRHLHNRYLYQHLLLL